MRLGKNEILLFFILIRHFINPFKPIGKILAVMNERLTNKEKTFVIQCSNNEILTKILRENFDFN